MTLVAIGTLRVKYCAHEHRLILESMFKVKNALFLHYKTYETVKQNILLKTISVAKSSMSISI